MPIDPESRLLLQACSWRRSRWRVPSHLSPTFPPLEMDCTTMKTIWRALKPRQRLERDCCDTNGIVCDNSGRVTELDLSFTQSSGTIPTEINRLTELRNFEMAGNSLHGQIPALNLPNLQILDLSNNRLTGSIGSWVGSMQGLKIFNINNNLISGQLPNEFRTLTRLEEFDISHTAITGKISNSWSLPNIKVCNVMDSVCLEGATLPSVCAVRACTPGADDPRSSPSPPTNLPSPTITSLTSILPTITSSATLSTMVSVIATTALSTISQIAEGKETIPAGAEPTNRGRGPAEKEKVEQSAVPLSTTNLAIFIGILVAVLVLVSYITIYAHHQNSNQSHDDDTESIAEEALIDKNMNSASHNISRLQSVEVPTPVYAQDFVRFNPPTTVNNVSYG